MDSESTDSGFVDNWQGNKTLSECNLHMLTSEDSCDVCFRVGENEETVRSHRYILISRSCVFHAMLCGPLAEKNDIKILDVCKELFAEFLKFLYTDECCLTPENVTGLIYLSKKYAVGGLEKQCWSFLETSLSADNACIILEQAHLFDEKKLHEEALKVIAKQGSASLNTSGLKDLCRECFDKVLKSDELCAKPELVFTAALTWADAECRRQGKEVGPQNQRLVLGQSLYQIPFSSFEAQGFVKTVIASQILTESEALKIMSYVTCPETDVRPFRIFHKKRSVYEVEMYQATSPIPVPDVELFREKYVHDSIRVLSDCDVYLHGVVLQSGGGAAYDIYVTCQSGQLLSTWSFTTTPSSSKFNFGESIALKKNTEYDIVVAHVCGECPVLLGSSLKQHVELDVCTLTMKRTAETDSDRGLLSMLIIGTAPHTGE